MLNLKLVFASIKLSISAGVSAIAHVLLGLPPSKCVACIHC